MDNPLHTFPNRQDLEDIQKKIPQLDVPSMEVIMALMRTAGELSCAFNAYLANFGLSLGKMKILLRLYQNPEKGLLPSELAICSGVTRGTITGLLDGLEKEGYVERIHHQNDRRMIMIKLTSKGQEQIELIMPKHLSDAKKLISQVGESQRESLLSTLGTLLSAIPSMHD